MKKDRKQELRNMTIRKLKIELEDKQKELARLNRELMMGSKRATYPTRSVQQAQQEDGETTKLWFGNVQNTKKIIAFIKTIIREKGDKN